MLELLLHTGMMECESGKQCTVCEMVCNIEDPPQITCYLVVKSMSTLICLWTRRTPALMKTIYSHGDTIPSHKIFCMLCNLQVSAYCLNISGGHCKKLVVPAANAVLGHSDNLWSRPHGHNSFTSEWWMPHTMNVILGMLYYVFGSQVLSDQFPELSRHGWSLLPCSPDANPVVISFTATSEIVYITSTQHHSRFASGNWSCFWRDCR